jgi:type VI protein secretion system component Hcp
MKLIQQSVLLVLAFILFGSSTYQGKRSTFVLMTDPSGKPIRGNSVTRGFERQILATEFSGIVSGNPKVEFSMESGATSATLSNYLNHKSKIPYAVFTVTQTGDQRLNTLYTVRLEDLNITRVRDANGITIVTLQAGRIGTTYYHVDRKIGTTSVSGKTGYDFINQQPWSSF